MLDLENNKHPIFNVFYPYNNCFFFNMNGNDLNDFFKLLINFNIELRKTLDLKSIDTFGLEIEYENTTIDIFKNDVSKKWLNIFENTNSNWCLKDDLTLLGKNQEDYGIEITTPILTDKFSSWKKIDEICKELQKHSEIGPNCGAHIHIGAHIFNNNSKAFFNFLKLWSAYENIIFTFTNGEFACTRPSFDYFSKSMIRFYKNFSFKYYDKDAKTIIQNLPDSKNNAVTFVECVDFNCRRKFNTLEFRSPNGTLSPVIWQNNVNLFIKMIYHSCSESFSFNEHLMEEKMLKQAKNFKDPFHNIINIEDALVFADIVFNTNLDKIYFLRQYFKDFKNDNSYVRTRKFYK